MIKLYKGDCIQVLKRFKEQSIDAIITDIPYGIARKKWDKIINFVDMWEQLERVIKPNGAIVLFGIEPFASTLRLSNIKNYRYDWYWDKCKICNFFSAKRVPLKKMENIMVFSKLAPVYYPVMEKLEKEYTRKQKAIKSLFYDKTKLTDFTKAYTHKYPKNLIKFSNACIKNRAHPTQKPISLMEYLIKTYTKEKQVVLDFTMGSGTTGIACVNLNRSFIGIEKDNNYFNIAKNRFFCMDSKK